MVAGSVKQAILNTVTITWEFAWTKSALVILDEWSFYRGDRLNRFDCK